MEPKRKGKESEKIVLPFEIINSLGEVTIGQLGNAETARNQLTESGIELVLEKELGQSLTEPTDLLDKIDFEKTEKRIELVYRSLIDLMPPETDFTFANIYVQVRSARHKLTFCPAEAVLQRWLEDPKLVSPEENILIPVTLHTIDKTHPEPDWLFNLKNSHKLGRQICISKINQGGLWPNNDDFWVLAKQAN